MVPLPPFEWYGVESVKFEGSAIAKVAPLTVINNPILKPQDSVYLGAKITFYGNDIKIDDLYSETFSFHKLDNKTVQAFFPYDPVKIEGGYELYLDLAVKQSDITGIDPLDLTCDNSGITFQLRNITFG